jgi:hypothetical protein
METRVKEKAQQATEFAAFHTIKHGCNHAMKPPWAIAGQNARIPCSGDRHFLEKNWTNPPVGL